VCFLLLAAAFADAGDAPGATGATPVPNDDKIYVTADELISDSNAYSFEFIGNVKATQGNSVITSDRLKVLYNKDADHHDTPLADAQTIQKITAEGHVVITFEDRVAKAERAVYTTETKILVLSGPDSTITRGSDTISGEVITLYRNEERIKVESGKEKRVEAVFHAGDQGIN
jgi:lipopolysaccharide export system protein LptA